MHTFIFIGTLQITFVLLWWFCVLKFSRISFHIVLASWLLAWRFDVRLLFLRLFHMLHLVLAGGSYLFVNSSNKGAGRAILVSPPVSLIPTQKKCLHFSFYMHGPTSNCCQLHVKLHNADNMLTSDAWSRSSGVRDRWVDAVIVLQSDGPYQVKIWLFKNINAVFRSIYVWF